MKKLLLTLCILSVCMSLFAQQINNWYLGYPTGTRINFNTVPPTVTSAPLTTDEGSSAISDAAGNPLFYTNGLSIWDASTNTTFGTGMLGNSSGTQTAVVMPRPGFTNQWLVFTGNAASGTPPQNGINYYVVSGSPGAFTLSAPTSLATATQVGEHLCIIGSTQAGTDFWVLTRARSAAGTNEIWAYAVSSAGVVSTTPVTSSAGGIAYQNYQGFMKTNSCQTRLAITYYISDNLTEVYSFNTATGMVVPGSLTTLSVPNAYGVEWSTNDQYLYVSELGGQLRQYTVGAPGSAGAGWPVFTSGTNYGGIQLGPNGRLYIARISTSTLGEIVDPNVANAPVGSFALAGGVFRGMPTFPKSLTINKPIISPASGTYCTNTTIPFSYIFGGDAVSQTWSISPGAGWSYSSGNGSSLSPSVLFTAAGTYTVSVTVRDACGRDWVSDNVTITIEAPKIPAGTISCSGNTMTLTATGTPSSDYPNYVWYDAAVGGNELGIGGTVNLNYGNNAAAPSSVWVEVANSATLLSSGSQTAAASPTVASMTYVDAIGNATNNPISFNVLADVLELKTVSLVPSNYPAATCTTISFTLEIRNSSNAVVFTNAYSNLPITCNTALVIPINTTLAQGNGYNIRLTGISAPGGVGYVLSNSSYTTGTQANVFNYLGPASAYDYLGAFTYDWKRFTVTSVCPSRVQVNRVCTLPVEWVGINAHRDGNTILVRWETSMEQDNDYFIVQRSSDGINFFSIGTVDAVGNSRQITPYEFVDSAPLSGTLYYRIVQIDIDGASGFSPIATVNDSGSNFGYVSPNPSQDQFELTLIGKSDYNVTLYNVLGVVLSEKELSGEEISWTFGKELSKGVYMLTIKSDAGQQTLRVVKD